MCVYQLTSWKGILETQNSLCPYLVKFRKINKSTISMKPVHQFLQQTENIASLLDFMIL